jgi:peptidoglycan/LPS O-acetylase OafA/YrhL
MRTAHSWTRLDGVDVLRGLAIFFVLMNHVHIRLIQANVDYSKGLPDQLVSALVWNGQCGVQIFFAISGFLITSTTIRRWGALSRVDVRDFYLLRFARIAPLFLLLVGVLSAFHLAHMKHFVISPETGGLSGALFAAFTFRVNVLEARHGYLPGSWDILWSLSVEEMFYFFFPPICRVLGRGKLLIVLLTGFVVCGPFARTVFAHRNEIWREYSYLAGMDAIALGCLTALLVSRVRFSPYCAPDSSQLWDSHSHFQPRLFHRCLRCGPGKKRPPYNHSRGGHLHEHRFRSSGQVDGAMGPASGCQVGSTQLRDLSYAHVRSLRPL